MPIQASMRAYQKNCEIMFYDVISEKKVFIQ